MQRRAGECVIRAKMEELRLVCDKEIEIQQRRIETTVLSFHKSLQSINSMAQETVLNQEKVGKLKAQLRAVEDDLVKSLSVKTRKEAKKMAISDSISAAKTKVEDLKKLVADQRSRKDEYAALMSHQSEVMKEFEEKHKQDAECREDMEEAISWYNRVLGFRIERGRGIRFIFTNVNQKNPNEEYSFTIRLEGDNYTLLDCRPQVNEVKKLIQELNINNGLYSFVRTMREKFQQAAACGNLPEIASRAQDASIISVSAPVSSVSTDSQSGSPAKENIPVGNNIHPRNGRHVTGGKSSVLSPGSASSLRRSPRFKVKK